MNTIIPTILTDNFNEFKNKLDNLITSEIIFPFIQIDVMDGKFVNNISFKEREEINQISQKFDFELHLMVEHPINEIETWKKVSSIKKVLIPVEGKDDIQKAIKLARDLDWSVGLSVNPETSLEKIDPHIDHIDSVLFLTVNPGAQGNPLIPEVGEKVKKFKETYAHMTCSVDGGINTQNIALVNSWGADYFCIGSALIGQSDIKTAYNNLINSLENIE